MPNYPTSTPTTWNEGGLSPNRELEEDDKEILLQYLLNNDPTSFWGFEDVLSGARRRASGPHDAPVAVDETSEDAAQTDEGQQDATETGESTPRPLVTLKDSASPAHLLALLQQLRMETEQMEKGERQPRARGNLTRVELERLLAWQVWLVQEEMRYERMVESEKGSPKAEVKD